MSDTKPMSEAPTDGTVIEILVDGDWVPAYWSDDAYDGPPYGTTGWAQEDDGYLILDGEHWREVEDPRRIDVAKERELEAQEMREAEREQEAQDRKERNRHSREQSARNRQYLEDRYATLFGKQPDHMKMVDLRRSVQSGEAARALSVLGQTMKAFTGI